MQYLKRVANRPIEVHPSEAACCHKSGVFGYAENENQKKRCEAFSGACLRHHQAGTGVQAPHPYEKNH
jgi:hypothetical protein